MKPAALNRQEELAVDHDKLDSEEKSIKEDCKDSAQQTTTDAQEVQHNEPRPDVSEPFQECKGAYSTVTVPSEEHHAESRLELAEKSDSQHQQSQSDRECKNKMQNALVASYSHYTWLEGSEENRV